MNSHAPHTNYVAPAKAGAQSAHPHFKDVVCSVGTKDWAPAFAGATGEEVSR